MPYLGRGAAVGMAKETTWGTTVARTHWFPLVDESMKMSVVKRPRRTLNHSTGSRNIRKHVIERIDAGGGLTLLATYEGFGLLLEQLLGAAPTVTGTNPYTHVYALAAVMPTGVTIEMVRGTGTGELFAGGKLSKGTFTIEVGKEMTFQTETICKSSGGRISAATPTLAASRDLVVMFDQAGTVGFNGGTYTASKLKCIVDNKLARRNLLGDRYTKEPHPSAEQEIILEMELEWNDDVLVAAYTADTEADLAVTFTDSAARTWTFALASAYLDDCSDPVNQPGIIKQTVRFRAQVGATNEGIKITVVNTQATGLLT